MLDSPPLQRFQDSCRVNLFKRLFLLWFRTYQDSASAPSLSISRLATPGWMSRSGRLHNYRIPFRQQRYLRPMPLVGGDEADTAMPVLFVIPSRQNSTHSGRIRLANPSDGLQTVLQRQEQWLESAVIVADPRPSPRGRDARSYILVSSVTDFIGAPLSECKTSGCFQHCSRMTLRCSNAAACSPHSCSCTSQPTLCGCRCPLSDRGSNTGRARVTASR